MHNRPNAPRPKETTIEVETRHVHIDSVGTPDVAKPPMLVDEVANAPCAADRPASTRRDAISAIVDLAVFASVTILAVRGVLPGSIAGIVVGSLAGARAAAIRTRSALTGSATGALLVGLFYVLSFRTLWRA